MVGMTWCKYGVSIDKKRKWDVADEDREMVVWFLEAINQGNDFLIKLFSKDGS